jgi:hypothetical protein
MNAEVFIRSAIDRGALEGLESLGSLERTVFLISEAEVHCDKDGIDALVHQYGCARMPAFAEAFLAVGATSIARRFAELAANCLDESLLSSLNELITSREGYSFESIKAHVAGSI